MGDIYLDPDQFPVDPNGAADSTAGIQAALNALKAEPLPRRLIVPLGYYKMSGTGFVSGGSTTHQYAVKIDFGDFEIVSLDSVNASMFFLQADAASTAVDVGTTLFYIVGASLSSIKLTRLVFRGPTLTAQSQVPLGEGEVGSLVFFHGLAWDQKLSNSSVTGCNFEDPVRYGIALYYARQVTIDNCYITITAAMHSRPSIRLRATEARS